MLTEKKECLSKRCAPSGFLTEQTRVIVQMDEGEGRKQQHRDY